MFQKKLICEDGEMAQQLRVLPDIAEDPSSAPS